MKSLNLFLLLMTLVFTSCSGIVNKMHKDFDRHDKRRAPKRRYDKFAMYRDKDGGRYNGVSTKNRRFNPPKVKRQYRPKAQIKKRYKANDLADNQSDGSLWSEQSGDNNFLFTVDKNKKNGDIVVLNVQGKLKNEITAELKRAFPVPKKKKKKKAAAAAPGAPATAAKPPAKEGAKDVDEGTNKVYDKISSVIIEEINKDHILIRGRKNLLYRNRKRMVEVQALVSRRDVDGEDAIPSDRILESNVSIVR